MTQNKAEHTYPDWMTDHDIDFVHKLENIAENRTMVLTCDKLSSNEYIECTSSGFRYEDGGFLGYTPIHCLSIFKTQMFKWAENAIWTIVPKASVN